MATTAAGARVVALASDHAGLGLKQELHDLLRGLDVEVLDLGTHGADSVDYPDYGHAVAQAVGAGRAGTGVVVCGTGIGIAMAANRDPRVRAAVCHDVSSTRLARAHNDANVLALGARITGPDVAADCLKTFLETPFDGGRHARRVAKLGQRAAETTEGTDIP